MNKAEIVHMLISVITISLAFSLGDYTRFPIILLTIGIGFSFHEMAHKFVAIKFGCVAVYRAWMQGLVLALFMALATGGRFVFAAPGAVYIYKEGLTNRENGIISLAGPLTNILIGIGFFLLFLATPAGSLASTIGRFGFYVNMFLAFFNMLPIPPLDGSKVFRWNIGVWVLLIGVAAILMFYPQVLFVLF